MILLLLFTVEINVLFFHVKESAWCRHSVSLVMLDVILILFLMALSIIHCSVQDMRYKKCYFTSVSVYKNIIAQ